MYNYTAIEFGAARRDVALSLCHEIRELALNPQAEPLDWEACLDSWRERLRTLKLLNGCHAERLEWENMAEREAEAAEAAE